MTNNAIHVDESALEAFDIDLLEDEVEDEAEKKAENIVQFNISSYGADYTVDSLVKRLKDGAFYVLPFSGHTFGIKNRLLDLLSHCCLDYQCPVFFSIKNQAPISTLL